MNTEIQEGNVLIAGFMGLPHRWVEYPNPQLNRWEVDKNFQWQEIKFHSSWDWLRSVIDKIFEYSLAYPAEAAKVCNMTIVVNIDAAWQKVVQFIQWFNQKNKTI